MGTIGGELEEQLALCASFSSVLSQVGIKETGRGIDLGTGGGLPGLALAAMWPAIMWTLVDMRVARATEVERCALALGLGDRTEVVGIEAQQLGHDEHHRERYDVVVARAFGPASITAECAAGLVRVGGVFVVSEPPEQVDDTGEPRWDTTALQTMGFAGPILYEIDVAPGFGNTANTGDGNTAGTGGAKARFAVFEKESAAPKAIPRLPARSNRGWYRAPS